MTPIDKRDALASCLALLVVLTGFAVLAGGGLYVFVRIVKAAWAS